MKNIAIKYIANSILKFLKLIQFNFDKFNRLYFKFLLKEKIINKRWISDKVFIDDLNFYTEYVPDRYSLNIEQYLKINSFFEHKDLKKWVDGNFINNVGDLSRFYFFNLCFDILIQENIVGNVSELGVFRGNSAFLLSKYARKAGTKCFLFDTFESFDKRDLQGIDLEISKDVFSKTSLEEVRKLVGDTNTEYVKGYFPESLNYTSGVDNFALVHLDCDLEKPFIAALEYFYPKIIKGGFLIMHDYSSLCWSGAQIAIDNFFKDKAEFVIPIPDKSGTCVIRKII